MPGSSSSQFNAISDTNYVRVDMSHGQYRAANGVPRPYSPATENDYKLLEALARWTLAVETAKAYASINLTLGGATYAAKRSPRSQRTHVRASLWAQRHGLAFTLNRQTACALITRPGGDVILPLGSPKVKVGSQWRTIGDIVVADGEEVMIPVEIATTL